MTAVNKITLDRDTLQKREILVLVSFIWLREHNKARTLDKIDITVHRCYVAYEQQNAYAFNDKLT